MTTFASHDTSLDERVREAWTTYREELEGLTGAEYEAAWLACQLIADRAGERALVAVYDRVGAGEELDAVLRDVLGVGSAGLTRLWRSRLSDLAG